MYSENFTIRATEVDLSGNATLASLAGLMQEIAGNHASKLNFDITDLQKKNLTWVLHRMDIKMKKYPKWRDKITIETWPNAGDSLRAYRDYRILAEDGSLLGVALSYWMIINMETRRPGRIPKEILDLRLGDNEHVLDIKNNRPRPSDGSDIQKIFRVRKADLDMNRHVNNARYLEWVAETLPGEKDRSIRRADILFMKESGLGDVISSHMVMSGSGESDHRLLNCDNEVIALARLEFFKD